MSEPRITAEDLVLYAMDLLEGDEKYQVDAVLARSSEARLELTRIYNDLALLGLSLERLGPSPQARSRLLNDIAREPRIANTASADTIQDAAEPFLQANLERRNFTPQVEPELTSAPNKVDLPAQAITARDVAPASVQPSEISDESDRQDRYTPSSVSIGSRTEQQAKTTWFSRLLPWTGWALAGAFGVAALFGVQQNLSLRDQLNRKIDALNEAQANSQRAKQVLQTLQSNDSQRFVLTRAGAPPEPAGRVVYLAQTGSLVFQGSNLEALPASKTYQLWLIPAETGQQPIPAGTFHPDAHGYATLVYRDLPKDTVAANFGITMEDEGGSKTPTAPILLVGQHA